MAGLLVASAVLAACGDGDDTADCASGFKRCDGDCVATNLPEFGCAASGCEPCQPTHAASSCDQQGECAVASCEAGWGDCDNAVYGCETDLRADVENCGQCDTRCDVLPWPNVSTFTCGNFSCAILTCAPGHYNVDHRNNNGCESDTKPETGEGGAGGAPGPAPDAGGAGGAAGAGGASGAAGAGETAGGASGAAGSP